ncbi:MAG TPA: O-antigen ligase family protein [Pyrinomonadaceae bacterium]|nr:O-antigen ligase family protein [Pyrinomonadaceae bacterium]
MFDYEPVAPPRARRGARDDDEGESLQPGFSKEKSGADGGGGSLVASGLAAREGSRRAGLLKRGHALVYAGLFLFTAVLYFRPYEYLPLPSTLAFWLAIATLAVYVPSQLSVEGTLTVRTREVNLVLVFCALALVSVPLAISPGEAWQTFNDQLFKAALMFIIIVNAVRTERRLHGLFFLALAVSCTLSFAAISDFREGNFSVEGYRVKGLLGGMFGNPNDLALHLVTMIPLALALLLAAKGGLKKIVYASCAALFACAVIVTFSRGGFLGLACGLTVLVWQAGRRHRFAVLGLTAAALVGLLLLAPGSYAERIVSIVDFAKDPVGSATMRQQLFWRSVFTSIANPVFGVGIGNFHHVSVREQESHNAFTQVSSEMGLPALAVYVLFILSAMKSLRRVERETEGGKRPARAYYLAVGLQASLVAYCVSSFFASVAYQWYVYYLVGYAVAVSRMHAASASAATNDALDKKLSPGEPDDGRRARLGLEEAAART